MSIAPFLPGLPVPAATDGGTTADASGGDPGSAASAFGDALAAALAGALAVAPTPAPATAQPAPTPATPSPADLPVLPVDLPVTHVDVPVSSIDLPVPPAELAVSSAELAVSSAELAVPPAELAVPAAESGVPASRRTTDGAPAGGLTSALSPVDAGAESVSGASARETAKSTDQTANSTDQTAKSTVETANSASGIANSAGGIANSAGGIANSAVTKAVVQQVFPEVTRFVSTVTATAPGSAGPANGTHRITLTLQPEQLGEVRVTLVVKDGAVHVRLAGGEGIEGAAVHRALAGEAPELQRLLERTGAEARVTVRDPFAPLLPSTTPSPQAGPDTDARSGAQARQDRQDAQDGRTAREQPREQPRRQEPQRASYPIETTPVAGRLDRTV
ncbi:hypothetical protein CFH99_05270 [Nocardioides aromaticivorans]|uniref:Flagellar hook-length control protein-like C-terminal domain-containing protein n=1 Tax=Nocardioides aromaticivorans TaxID=200618 RepID=A0ABX7PH26_9ACTN|nr:hypothetical protein CFH99_05270 [Nocardioides aromaticivorans]